MDVDCDGLNYKGGDCGADETGQDETAFKDQLSQYGISDLDANIHPYVVFGNTDFDPQQYGMEPLSVMAVLCNDQVVCVILPTPVQKSDLANDFRSMVSGEILMARTPLVRRPSLLVRCVSPTMTSTVTMAMVRMMCSSWDSLVRMRFLEAVPTGRRVIGIHSKPVSRILETNWWRDFRLKFRKSHMWRSSNVNWLFHCLGELKRFRSTGHPSS